MSRFIVNGPFLFSLIAMTAIGSLYYVDNFLRFHQESLPVFVRPAVDCLLSSCESVKRTEVVSSIRDFVTQRFVTWTVIAIFAGVSVVACLTGWIKTVLHVLLDVVNHFYRERVWFRGKIDHKEHTIQAAIGKRFARTVRRTLDIAREHNVTIDNLAIVTHSQGTVVTILALNSLANSAAGNATMLDAEYELLSAIDCKSDFDRLFSCTESQVSLITMGSPFHHIYQRYFSDRYPPAGSASWHGWQKWFSRWVNIYRPDDFVGLDIPVENFGGKLENVGLKPGGHTNYWDAGKEPDTATQNPVVATIEELVS